MADMSFVKRIIDIGIQEQGDAARNRQIRFANSVALIVSLFIVQNAALALYYQQWPLLVVYGLHFIGFALVPFFNRRGKWLRASTLCSSVALFFVNFYSIVFGIESYKFMFLAVIILQFFMSRWHSERGSRSSAGSVRCASSRSSCCPHCIPRR